MSHRWVHFPCERFRRSADDARRARVRGAGGAGCEGGGGGGGGEGGGSNWGGFAPMDGVREFLGIPDELDVLTVVPFGYPAVRAGAGKKRRKPLGEAAHRGRLAEPFR